MSEGWIDTHCVSLAGRTIAHLRQTMTVTGLLAFLESLCVGPVSGQPDWLLGMCGFRIRQLGGHQRAHHWAWNEVATGKLAPGVPWSY
jgi:hypothetical protein